jgi:PHS family inorganic phosphate transporter-like MFS transporter
LNTSPILEIIGFRPSGNDTTLQKYTPLTVLLISLRNLGIGNIILSLAGLIPGYWLSVLVIDTVGRKRLQIGGFVALTIIFSIFGFGFHSISPGGLVTLVCLANLFANFGPNTTTFIVPGEAFPTRYRSTGHGISAASGKIGAIISQAFIGLRNQGGDDKFLNHVMQLFALFMYSVSWRDNLTFRLLGIATSILIPETKRKPLEELSGNFLTKIYYSNRQANSVTL